MIKMKFVIAYVLIAVTLIYESNGSGLTLKREYKLGNPLSVSAIEIDDAVKNKVVYCKGIDGTICSDDPEDCDKLYYCQPGRPGPHISQCPYNTTCNAGQCSSNLSSICEYRNQKFECISDGIYPEPSSCRRYNLCLPNNTVPTQSRCEHGWAYNPVTTFCDHQLQKYTCADYDRPVPKCLTLGQNGALKTNPVLYYVCLPYNNKYPTIYYPFIYKCPRNTKYVGNYTCT